MSVTSTFEYFVTLLSHADTFPLPENRIIILLEILNLGYLDCLNSCFLEMDILFQMKSIIIFLDLMHWKKLYLNRQSFRQRKNLIIIFSLLLMHNYAGITIKTINIKHGGDIAVSYTHLDVYKRQAKES